jgi:hypothetical protein
MSTATFRVGGGDRALWLGLGPVRLAVAIASLLVSVACSYAGVNLVVAFLPLAAATGWCFGTLGGTPLHELTRSAVCFATRALTQGRSWRVPLHPRATAPARLALPAECGRLNVCDTDIDGVTVGVLTERVRSGWTVGCILRVSADAGFALADPEEQVRRLVLWGDVLTTLGVEYGDRCRLQWVETATVAAPAPGIPPELASVVATAGRVHTTRLAVWVNTREKSHEAATRQAAPLVRLLTSRMLAAELVLAPLRADQVSQVLGQRKPTGADERVLLPGHGSRREAWDHTRTDDSLHRGFLVTGWPTLPSSPSWLAPLLTASPAIGQRTVSIHLQAVRSDIAGRRARAARQSAQLDAEERSRLGFGIGARQRQVQADAELLEDELAAGHVQHRVAGLIVVTADDLAELDQACQETLAHAATARLEVRALHGQHALAWAAGLPLCRLGHRAVA